ncbi:DUF5134 domain-containing protein [Pseudarthrobacter sulfonivorans]|uniref:DUF5134 domain-containing protein n=1 Tax=Pseudarthrobacter sulfonivorans TaxID=121292 RepID=UPI002102F788|nr:DUF5134 domain-containing protein [Pseudarthrobacter sulfonivorans]
MFSIPAINWGLTAILLLSGAYYLMRAARGRHLTDRANSSLHALMNGIMAAMVWNLAPSTMLAQIAVLAGAALWFVLQAVARPEFRILCDGSQDRLKCIYHSLTMAAAAVMIAMMGLATTQHDSPAAMPTPHTHHSMAAASPSAASAAMDHSPALALLLTVLFGTAAVFFAVRWLGYQKNGTSHRRAAASRRSGRAEHGLEAIGAAVMALMFASMSA